MSAEPLPLAGGSLVVTDPEELLASYLDPAGGYAWPAYDLLVTNGRAELVTGDLLAPVLLGAHVDAARFAVLQEMVPQLAGVARLPDVALQDADDDVVERVAALFEVLDSPLYRRRGVRGTVVSKVLHRKRPDLVPLYDSRVYAAYTAEGAVPREAHHTWREFMVLLCRQMRADLRGSAERFDALQALATDRGATMSRLRILDVLVWMSLEDA